MYIMSKMFEVAGKRVQTWNPIGGECAYDCPWCWARRLIKQKKMQKYQGKVFLVETALQHQFKPGEIVFVQDMSDLFSMSVPDVILNEIMLYLSQFPETTFYVLTKNPERYLALPVFPENIIFGVTIETDFDMIDQSLNAPSRLNRFYNIVLLQRLHPGIKVFVSIEPIMSFTLSFVYWLRLIMPFFVYLGYDNYHSGLTEPRLAQVKVLIAELEQFTEVRTKTMREQIVSKRMAENMKRLEDYF